MTDILQRDSTGGPEGAGASEQKHTASGDPVETPRLVIISGISGSGKTQALHICEDLGFYCVDNLPPALLPELAALRPGGTGIAVVIDVRAGEALDRLDAALTRLREQGTKTTTLFLETSDEVLINRFKETRRRHPVKLEAGGILPSIHRERELLAEIKSQADTVLDTTGHTPRSLSRVIQSLLTPGQEAHAGLLVTLVSFGFKHGLPMDADLVFDVRFLRNPHYVRELRWQDGRDAEVAGFVHSDPRTNPFLQRLRDLILFTLPAYVDEGKAYLTIAIGCTGGRHRSVMVAEEIAAWLRDEQYTPLVHHRDLKK